MMDRRKFLAGAGIVLVPASSAESQTRRQRAVGSDSCPVCGYVNDSFTLLAGAYPRLPMREAIETIPVYQCLNCGNLYSRSLIQANDRR